MSDLALDFPEPDDEPLWFYDDEDGDSDVDTGLREECPAFRMENGDWHCPLIGSEECDWDCGLGGWGWWDRLEDEGPELGPDDDEEMPF
jgi:hypothetical protein